MYILVVLAFNVLGDVAAIAIQKFDTRQVCEALLPNIGAVLLREKRGLVPTEVHVGCFTETEFTKVVDAVSERSRKMEQEGVRAKNSAT